MIRILFIPLILLAVPLHAAKLRGTVLCSKGPVAFAVVGVKGTSFGNIADSAGNFVIYDVPPGRYLVEVNAAGYITSQKKISLNNDSENEMKFYLEEDPATLDEVVVSGTLNETSMKESAIPIEVLTPKLFRKNPTPSLFDAMNMVNGVQPQLNCSVCNTGDIHINGMEGPYTMITIDGMPIVSSLSTVYGLSGIPNSIVQRIEIVKGPAGTLYGSEAVGGLINVITKLPYGQPRLSVDVNGTGYGELNVDLSSAQQFGKKVSTLLGVSAFYFNERWDINNDNFTDVTLQKRFSVFNKWNFEGRAGRNSAIAFRYVFEDRFGGEMNWDNNYRGSDSIYGESIFTNRWEVIGNYRLPVRQLINFQYSYNHHLQDSYYGISKFYAEQQVAFAQLLWNKNPGAGHHILAGIPVRFTYYDDNSVATQIKKDSLIENSPQHIFLPGVFVQDEWDATEKIKLLPGIRFDFNSVHGPIFSPRFAMKYKYNDKTNWRLSLGNGYRVVNLFTEDHAALTGSREVIITEDLKPEKSWNGIISFSKTLVFKNAFLNVDANCFYTYFTNKIVGDFLTDPEKIIYDNLHGYAISRGQATNFELGFKSGLKFIVGYTLMEVFQINQDTAGNASRVPQLFAPPFSTTFAVSWRIPRVEIEADLTGRLNGPMHLPVLPNDFRPEKSPWFCIANFQLTKKIKGVWEFYGGVKNFLNFLPQHPIMRPFDPFDKNINDPVNNPGGYTFDTSYNYAPLQGIRWFAGIRFNIK